jgi:predicted MPP superfamily phosphohydrolase
MASLVRSGMTRLLGTFGAQSWVEASGVVVRRYSPAIAAWPQGQKLRIAMLSDFHFCSPWSDVEALKDIVEKTNALEPDVILLLGDYEEGPRFSEHLAPDVWAAPLAGLKAPLGVHAVFGNHDYPRIARRRHRVIEYPEAQRALDAVGIETYINRSRRLEHNGAGFWLAGLGDQIARHEDGRSLADLDATLAQVTDDAPVILMAHEPDIFPEVPARVALTLSGHVHRGQIRFFGFAPVVPSRYGRRYLHGNIVEGGRHLIVSAGLGHSGLPLRFDATPEIVLIELGGQLG